MSRAALFSTVALWLLAACASSSGDQRHFAEANPLMAEEIRSRVAELEYQHRDELLQNLSWLVQAGEQAIPTLLDGIKHPSAKVRSSSAWVLGQIGDRRVIGDLQAVSRDPNPTTRLEVARSLVVLGDIRECPPLIEALDSDKVQVRYLCHEALKTATGHDFGYDHLSDNVAQRRRAVLSWRQWWSDMSGDPWFAKTYAKQFSLGGAEGWSPSDPPPAPGGSGAGEMIEMDPQSPAGEPNQRTGGTVPLTDTPIPTGESQPIRPAASEQTPSNTPPLPNGSELELPRPQAPNAVSPLGPKPNG